MPPITTAAPRRAPRAGTRETIARCKSRKKLPRERPARPAREGRKRSDAGCRRDELQPHQRAELREIAHRHFARIVLQVGVRGEGCRRVEDQAALDPLLAVGVERQILLQGHDAEADREHHRVEGQHRDHVLLPVLRSAGERSADDLEEAVKRAGRTIGRRARLHRPFHVAAKRPREQRCAADNENNEKECVSEHRFSPGQRSGLVDRGSHPEEQPKDRQSEKQIDDRHGKYLSGHARCRAVIRTSISLMPTNGTIRPPNP